MKALIFLSISIIAFFSACTKDDAAPATNNETAAAVVTQGTWRITSFTQKTEDKTSDFAGVSFTFSNDGTLTASGTKTATGTWVSAPPVTGYYSNDSSLGTLSISIATGSPFNRLTETWHIVERSNTTVKLDHREAAEDEHVTFSKN